MRYYVVSDVHGFYTKLVDKLEMLGFFSIPTSKLILCGDAFDRGHEARKLQDFLLNLREKDRLIYIRGNHEDLAMNMLKQMKKGYVGNHHISNRTFHTAYQLADLDETSSIYALSEQFEKSPFITELIPSTIDYFEIDKYIFVHGWIPCKYRNALGDDDTFIYNPDWRNAGVMAWNDARWINGMNAHRKGCVEPNKTIVCGHYHTSWGHSVIEKKCKEFSYTADFTPYRAPGIIAIDGCVAYSGLVNCLVIDV